MLSKSSTKINQTNTNGVRRKRDYLLSSFRKKDEPEQQPEKTKSFNKVYNNPTYLIPNNNNSKTLPIPSTRAYFLDAYGKAKWNLSNVTCPEFIQNNGLMAAPESYNESRRLKTVKNYINSPTWKSKTQEFQEIINDSIKSTSVAGGAISLVEKDVQILKFSHWLSLKEYPRKISIDAHSILSSQYFMLLDTLEDWRFRNNPIVKSYPNIRFYVGIPLISPINNEVIGVFSIFDGFPRNSFDTKHICELQESAKKIMSILHEDFQGSLNFKLNFNDSSTFDDMRKDNKLTRNKIGRATSDKSLCLIKLPIYEKDGSGNAYQQNLNFRFSKRNLTEEEMSNNEFLNKFLNCNNFRAAGRILCEGLSEKLQKFNLIYISEVKIVEVYQLESKYFPNVNEIEAEKFKFTERMQKLKKEEVKTRVINFSEKDENSHSLSENQIEISLTSKDSNKTHFSCFSSEFGIFVNAKVNSCKYNYGCCIPFVRDTAKLTRRKYIKLSNNLNNNNNNSAIPIELYLKTGGYLIGCFCYNTTTITDNDINQIFDSASIYRKLYIQNNN